MYDIMQPKEKGVGGDGMLLGLFTEELDQECNLEWLDFIKNVIYFSGGFGQRGRPRGGNKGGRGGM